MKKALAVTGLATLAVAMWTMPVSATVVNFELDTEFSGADQPEGTAPWVTASFDDGGGSGTVTLTISASGLVEEEFISQFYFNYSGATSVASLSYSVSGTNPTGTWDATDVGPAGGGTDIEYDTDNSTNPNLKADGDGNFDIAFNFPTSGNTFGATETLTVVITGTGITAGDFNSSSVMGGGAGTFHVAAHIQSIDQTMDNDNAGSGWIGDGGGGGQVPEPSLLLLLGAGLMAMGGFAASRRRQAKS